MESSTEDLVEEYKSGGSIMFGIMKDKALAKGAQMAVNSQIEDYGKVQSLHLNSKTKSIDMEITLNGELDSIKVHIANYELTETAGRSQLRVNGVTTSRAWINKLTSARLEGRTFDIPDEYGKILKTMI